VALPLFGVFFLENLLELVQFLAQLRERLLCGIGFLSTFLSGTKIGFFRSVFLKTAAIASIMRRVRAPMLLAQVAMFLGAYLFRDSGTFSTRLLRTLLLAVQRFLVARRVGFVVLPSHTRARLPQETEEASVCLREYHLSHEGCTDPATRRDTFGDRDLQISLGKGHVHGNRVCFHAWAVVPAGQL
jgi:hypothetical protein